MLPPRTEKQRHAALVLGMLLLAGCRMGTEHCVESRARQSAAVPADITPGAPQSAYDEMPPAPRTADEPATAASDPAEGARRASDRVETVAFQQQPDETARFAIPDVLPGADAPPLELPQLDQNARPEQRRAAIREFYRELPLLPDEPEPATDGEPAWSLVQLQQLAVDNSPVIRQAAAEVEDARGAAVQAGAYPNPTIGYQADSINTADTAGYHGGFISQTFVTADKLSLAQCAALMRMRAAEFALRRARIRLASEVRRGYFDVLIAQERVRFTRAIAQLTHETYQAHIELVEGQQAALYEPLQLRVQAVQSRNAVLRAENDRVAAWKSLAATLGTPELPVHAVVGSVDLPVPRLAYDAALSYILTNHSDLAEARAQIDRAGFELRLQRVTPIPNIEVTSVVQHDDTSPLNDMAYNLQVGVPIPLFNKNRGNIISAEAQLIGARQDWENTRNRLVGELAETFNRYQSNAAIAESYRRDILRDQVQSYRGVYTRFRATGDDEGGGFAQLIVAQQTLGQVVNEYLDVLRDQWRAVVDLAEILQMDDLYAMDEVLGGVPPEADEPADELR